MSGGGPAPPPGLPKSVQEGWASSFGRLEELRWERRKSITALGKSLFCSVENKASIDLLLLCGPRFNLAIRDHVESSGRQTSSQH